MAPEYTMEGLFSIKNDVYSFGILMLEIVSGKKNSGFYHLERAQSLPSYVRISTKSSIIWIFLICILCSN